MLAKIFTKRNILFSLGGFFLLTFVFCLSILVYFLFAYKGEERMNLVLLGESGPGHAGATLTDTIIFTSVSQQGTIFISVPRDLWYQPWQTKINSLYYYGQEKGDGFGLTRQILGEILGQKIDHTLLIDFTAFKDLVDLVGGVDVVVERSFDDFLYPLAGREDDPCGGDPEYRCRYEHVHFEAGPTHLDGEQALKFVRSRYAEGEEGTDEARSARQQKVISALKEKIASPAVLLSPRKIKGLWEIFQQRISSDISRDDLLALAKIFIFPRARQFQNFIINNWQEEKGLIYHPQKHPSGQWVLLLKDASGEELRQFIGCLIFQENKSSCFPEQK